MGILRDAAVVLGRLDYSETSQVVVFFTREHGKVRAIGKGLKRGTKKRFAVGIDLLDIGQLVVSSRQERTGLATLTEWKQTQSLVGLRDRLARLHAGQYAVEITEALTEDWDPHPDLFDALVAALRGLAESDDPLVEVTSFQRTLLDSIGLLPRFEACVSCGRAEDLAYFSSHEGGMICRHCEPGRVEKREVSSATLSHFQGNDAAIALAGPFALLNYHLSHLMGRRPRLASKLVPSRRQSIIE